jgi:hypothetical protein
MPILALLLAAQAPNVVPPCRPAQLRLVADSKDGEFDGMSHSGVELLIRNRGSDCALPVLPTVEMRDRHGRLLPAVRQQPVGMHPGPVMVPLRLARGSQAAIDLRWVSGAVYTPSRSVNAATVTVRIGAGLLRAPLGAALYGPAGERVRFDQASARPAEARTD